MTAPRSLVDDLRRPEAYPAPRPSAVVLMTTHISWVFLTDREAWKIKRPVDYGFVDYASPDKRRRCCEEEVRLNRRLAPDVYLGVVPVRLGPTGHTLGPEGTVVDHAVRMRRLSEATSADALLRRGALTALHLTSLVVRLARFYTGAAPAPAYGALDVIRANVIENFTQTAPFVGRFVPRVTFDRVRAWQHEFLGREAARFRARLDQGRIREGHGDLRLEHVYFEGPAEREPIVIDAIEFNERFRMGDVAADVAFLAMELTARSRGDLAEVFLAGFAQETDDHDLYGVIDFYASYRAWVRAKVAAFLAVDPTTPPDKAARKAGEAQALFALARAYTEPRPLAPVMAVGGLIGSGKSTLAEALGLELACPIVGSDRVRKALAGVPPRARAPEEAYSPAFSEQTFEELFRRAEVVVAAGRGIILDATFRSRALRLRARDLARRHARRFLFVETVCDDATLRERLRRRAGGPSVSDATEDLLERFRRDFEPVTELAPSEHVRVDTARSVAEQVAAVRAALAG
jgi:aminoglycoside phosphotransferase family enzyme/predicted kinase